MDEEPQQPVGGRANRARVRLGRRHGRHDNLRSRLPVTALHIAQPSSEARVEELPNR